MGDVAAIRTDCVCGGDEVWTREFTCSEVRKTSSAGTSALLSVVVPCFNEEVVLTETHHRLVAALEQLSEIEFEIVYVDDGSQDATLDLLQELQRAEARRVLALSRNFGQQMAITGL